MLLKNLPSALLTIAILAGCSSGSKPARPPSGAAIRRGEPPASLNVHTILVPAGRYGRNIEFPLRPTYITIHSTQNPGGTALQHAQGMQRGAFRGRTKWNRTGYNTWHFTVDDKEVVQSLPLNIQGEHADHEGPGNTTSIAIEVCEFRNPARQRAAVERTARLTAWLMREYHIPLDHVVPHYHWPQWHFHGHQKNCPTILLDRGKPGPKWQAFLALVERS